MGETVEIIRVGHSGDGVTADGLFVPYTVPGDVVRILRQGGRGQVLELARPGPSRATPACAHFGRCGGCALQMLERGAYLAWKRDQVVTALRQRGFDDPPVEPIRAVGPGTRRRANFKARATAKNVELGFYAPESRDLIDIVACPVLVPALAALLAPLKRQLAHVLKPGEAAELFATAADNGIDLAIKLKRKRDADVLMAFSWLASAMKLVRLSWNEELIALVEQPIHRIGRFTIPLPIWPFLQPTQEGERILQDLVRESAGEGAVADLFSGCGTFALALAETRFVHAVDDVSDQIDALAQAARAGGPKLTTEKRNLMKRPLAPGDLARFATVVLDPPRVGAKAQAEALAVSQVPRVLYVSCNPASFARDARILCDSGYQLKRVVPLDHFLWSPHVELFAEFVR